MENEQPSALVLEELVIDAMNRLAWKGGGR